ncbi:MAG: hypothetical protein KatS3mg056_0177 [Chloroflexus sp.]|jgi:hypothetical protein|nr:MAG: hypothetical protein KatS3mg056_0177 [Chloroflexus sp.]
MLPRQPCSRSGADCSGLSCRYVTLMRGMAERRPAACPTACSYRWCIGAGSVGAGSQPAPTDGICTVHLTIHGMRSMGMSCTACNGWLFRCDRSRYAPRSRAALCLTHTQVVTFFAHEQRLSHCARSWALSRCIAVTWLSRHERAADGRSGGGGSQCVRPWGRLEACQRGQRLLAMERMPLHAGWKSAPRGARAARPNAA